MNRQIIIAVFVVLIVLATAAVPQPAPSDEAVIQITARQFEFDPNKITVKRGVPVILEFTSADREHGFNLPAFGVRAPIYPGEVTRVRIVPQRTGRFPFECDVLCGIGHDDMTGELIVTE